MSAPTFRTAPAVSYSIIYPGDTRTPTNLVIYHGLQPDGRYLSMFDLDSHSAGQDAEAARDALARQFPKIHDKMSWHRSAGGKGWHGYVYTNGPLPHGQLYDQDGRHIGELIASDTAISIPSAGLQPGWLSATERDLLLRFWSIASLVNDGERWSKRAAEGMRYVRTWRRHQVDRSMLRTFLRTRCGKVGTDLDRLFDSRRPFDRSNAAGCLAQCLVLHIRTIAPGASFTELCALAMAYWMAADSYGKAGDKDYNQEKDGASLIAQIVNGDSYGPRDNSHKWIVPFWVKVRATPQPTAAEPATALAPAQPAHRPKGDQEKHLRTFRRVLAAIEPDDFGRRVYTLEYLSARMKDARSPAAPRTIQNYLRELRERGEIVTAQISGNGRPYAVLTSSFGGANNSKKAPDPAPKQVTPGTQITRKERPIRLRNRSLLGTQMKRQHSRSGRHKAPL